MADNEKGIKWWIRFVIVPLLAGGSLLGVGVIIVDFSGDPPIENKPKVEVKQPGPNDDDPLEPPQAVFEKGKVFQGTISYRDESQQIKVEISEIIGKIYIVEVSNPESEITQIFEGEIDEVFTRENFGISDSRVNYSPKKPSAFLVLRSRSPQSNLPDSAWRIYSKDTIIILEPTELGVDGVAEPLNDRRRGWDYKIVLRN